jgi:predicted AlkP superfamily pyrophosphatase or phosphodiesterase
MRRLLLVCVLLSAGAAASFRAQTPPRLLLLVVADQMRADHLITFAHRWQAGFRVLLNEGAWFPAADYPYLNTVTCAGHSTIATGTYPRTHGVILNGWFHRDAGAFQDCMTDPASPHISYGRPARSGSSTMRMLVPTLADELRERRPDSRVVVLGLKARSTIPMAGRGGIVTWFDEASGSFVTSRAYATEPVKEVAAFLAAEPFERDASQTWTLRAPEDSYKYADVGVGERPTAGWNALFPHPLAEGSAVDARFFVRWQKTPFSDAYLGRMAASLVDSLRLGQGATTDYLAVAFSALDMLGHDFGPRSREIEDMLMHLDATLGRLIAHLDQTVGRERYVLALTGDHGVAPIPEQHQAGRVVTEDIQQVAENALVKAWGPRAPCSTGSCEPRYVENVATGHVYFAPGVWQRLLDQPATLARVRAAILAMPGVARVLRADRVTAESSDAAVRAAAYGYFPGRSGELIVVPKPYWILEFRGDAEATEHGTMYSYDRRVPVLLLGGAIRHGRFSAPVSPADVAPTLAAIAGLRLPRAEGRVLSEVIK